MTVEPGAVETREEHARDTDYVQSRLVEKVEQIAGEHQVMSRTVETLTDPLPSDRKSAGNSTITSQSSSLD